MDAIVMSTYTRETFSKAKSGDEDEDKESYFKISKDNSGDEYEDTQSCCTLPGPKMSKDNIGDGEEDIQTNAELCYTLPSSQPMFKDNRVDRH